MDEYEFYIRSVAFSLSHTLRWCEQLDLAIELLSNFDYSKKYASKADHFIYNVENYYIKINSVYDRILQLTNSIFHICCSGQLKVDTSFKRNWFSNCIGLR